VDFIHKEERKSMELPGSNYLLTVAVISITFVAFSTIVVVLRQAQGAGLKWLDCYCLFLDPPVTWIIWHYPDMGMACFESRFCACNDLARNLLQASPVTL